jgi:hypothetical protein
VGSDGKIPDDCYIFGIHDLAPAIAEAGIAAVITTQAPTKPENWERFLVHLFRSLYAQSQVDNQQEHDDLDQVVSLARRHMEDCDGQCNDVWKPVLFSQLRTGRIWYTPHIQSIKGDRVQLWNKILESHVREKLLPIIGPSIIHDIAGSSREIARHWAYDYGFPMEHHNRMNLPQVAQYLEIQIGRAKLEEHFEGTIKAMIRERHGNSIQGVDPKAGLDTLFCEINRQQRLENPDTEPHGLLANLKVPLYLTTNLSGTLEQALKEDGKNPKVYTFNELARRKYSRQDEGDTGQPSIEEPWVIHLYGTLKDLEHAALTEDDYFDFINGFSSTAHQEQIAYIKRRLAGSSLIFLGFHIEQPDFRQLFRSIIGIAEEGHSRRYRHIAQVAQVAPINNHASDPRKAKEYLRRLLDEDDVSIYWGEGGDFLAELIHRSRA